MTKSICHLPSQGVKVLIIIFFIFFLLLDSNFDDLKNNKSVLVITFLVLCYAPPPQKNISHLKVWSNTEYMVDFIRILFDNVQKIVPGKLENFL